MTTYELARKLLEGPELPVMLIDWAEGYLPPRELEECNIEYPVTYFTHVRDEAHPGYWCSELHTTEAVGLGVGL